MLFTFNTDISQNYLFLGNLGKCILNPEFHNLGKFSILPIISVNVQSSIPYIPFCYLQKKLDISDGVGLEVRSAMRGNEE